MQQLEKSNAGKIFIQKIPSEKGRERGRERERERGRKREGKRERERDAVIEACGSFVVAGARYISQGSIPTIDQRSIVVSERDGKPNVIDGLRIDPSGF